MPYTPTWNSPYATTNPYQQMTVQPAYQQGIKKVNGPQSAIQYPVPPNGQSEPLFDFDGKTFYVVSADSAGYKTIETFDYSQRKESVPSSDNSARYVSRDEYDAFVRKVSEALDGIHGAVPTATGAATGATVKDVGTQGDDARRPIGSHIQSMPD